MIASLAALLLFTAPPAPPTAQPRAEAVEPADEELLRHLELLEQLDLLERFDLLVPEGAEPKRPPAQAPRDPPKPPPPPPAPPAEPPPPPSPGAPAQAT